MSNTPMAADLSAIPVTGAVAQLQTPDAGPDPAADAAAAMSGPRKAAIVLMQLDTERAAAVMKQLTEAEAQEIAAEIVRMRRVDSLVSERTLVDFYELTMSGRHRARGGRDVAMGLLEASFGAERASGVMDRLASTMAGASFDFLERAEPRQIVSLLEGELAQTIALVLAHLRPQHASAILAGFGSSLRADVAQAIATMTRATPEAVRVVAATLRERASALGASRDSANAVGGIQPLVDIINRADAVTERALLDALEARDPELAEQVRSRMLTFTDLVKLERRDVQLVLRGIDVAILALAMKGASESLTDTIRNNVSERNRDMLDDQIAASGPARLSQVEEARATIVRVIRDLEAQGIITVRHADEDEYVS